MLWNDHKNIEGLHAFLGASQYHWLNWNESIFAQRFYSKYSTEIGTAIHELAKDCINNRTKLNMDDINLINIILYRAHIVKGAFDSEVILTNLMAFVNDAIGFHMSPEVVLYYSPYCFGTTDAISYNEKEKKLRIHDLKTGSNPAHIEQLLIYAGLFCLEYKIKPLNISTELRIYQNAQVLIHEPEPKEIMDVMDKIVAGDKLARKLAGRG